MRPKRSTAAAGIAISAAIIALSACSSDTASDVSTEESGAAPEGPVIIASWGGAFSEATRVALAESFTADTGIEAQVLDTGNHVSMVQSMADAGTTEWDVLDSMAVFDSIYLDEKGLLAHWPADLQERLTAAYGADNVTDYGQAMSGYGNVVVCNMDVVTACPTTLDEFFDTEQFPGKRMMPGDPSAYNSLITSTAAVTGTTLDDDTDISVLADKLAEIKPSVSVWYTSGDQQNQSMIQGEADMGLMSSGRAYAVQDEGMNLKINWAGVYIVGSTNVLEDAPHKEAAFEFVSWMEEHPEAQAKWSEMMQYTTPSPEALELVPADIAERLATNPDNFEQLTLQNFDWEAKYKDEVAEAFTAVIAG